MTERVGRSGQEQLRRTVRPRGFSRHSGSRSAAPGASSCSTASGTAELDPSGKRKARTVTSSLARPAAVITLADIFLAVNEPHDRPRAGDEGIRGPRCTTDRFWEGFNAHVLQFLRSVTLQDFVDQQCASDIKTTGGSIA